jgi:hypothetical protein
MLTQLGTEPQLTISPRLMDGELGGLGGRASLENVMIDDAEEDPLGAGSGNQCYAACAVYQVRTFQGDHILTDRSDRVEQGGAGHRRNRG